MITIQKVVSQNFIFDWVAYFQNLFGGNLSVYEKMIEKGTEQLKDEIKKRGIKFKWYRIEVTQLTNGAVALLLYGDEQ